MVEIIPFLFVFVCLFFEFQCFILRNQINPAWKIDFCSLRNVFGNVTENPTIQFTTKFIVQQALKKINRNVL